ncbi:MAG: SDR family NAD(P)-dependent oxidoreductase [Nannocystaceae bacterium]
MTAPLHVFVTGAASGIGRCVVRELLGIGATIVATDIDEESLRQTAKDDHWPRERVTCVTLDVRDAAAIAKRFSDADARQPIDVMMNIAGVLRPQWCHELRAADIDLQIDVNVRGLIHGTRVASEAMIPRKRGHIINVASMAAFAPIPGISVYSATKFAARAFSVCAAVELEPHGICVTAVCPDAVETPMLAMQEHHDASAITFSGGTPLTPDAVARLMCTRVLRDRPRELAIPPSRRRLAVLANFFPALADWLYPIMLRRGQKHQHARKRSRALRPSEGSSNRSPKG